MRKYCGPDLPIIIKLTPVHGFEGGRELEEGIEILKNLDDKGLRPFIWTMELTSVGTMP